MGIDVRFTPADIKARFDNFMKVIEKRQINRLQYLGEQCVAKARLNGDYMDQTGNLRSSIGYVVFKNGVALHVNFEQTLNGLKGKNEGMNVAIKAGSKFKSGVCLVVVAGMNYALSVESKGRDVLTSTELFAKQELPRMMAELQRNINQAIG